jgi:hypothetical protein
MKEDVRQGQRDTQMKNKKMEREREIEIKAHRETQRLRYRNK